MAYSSNTSSVILSLRGIKASDQSLGSSFGCSFGSFNVNDSNNGISDYFFLLSMQHEFQIFLEHHL